MCVVTYVYLCNSWKILIKGTLSNLTVQGIKSDRSALLSKGLCFNSPRGREIVFGLTFQYSEISLVLSRSRAELVHVLAVGFKGL